MFGASCYNCIGATSCYNCNNACERFVSRVKPSVLFDSECVRVCTFDHAEVLLHMYCYSLFHTLFNNLHSIHICLLCKIPDKVSPLVSNNEKLNI